MIWGKSYKQLRRNFRLEVRIFHVKPSQPTDLTFPCMPYFFPPSTINVEIRVYLQISDTWINIGEGVTRQVFQQMWRVLYFSGLRQLFYFVSRGYVMPPWAL